MSEISFTTQEAEKYLAMDEDSLFAILVPEAGGQLYSQGGLIAKGKERFRKVFILVRDNVCSVYREHDSTIDNTVDLTILIATAISVTPIVATVPVLPFAALLVKIGLGELCREEKKDGEH